jgi:hypothetical protein
MLNALDSIAVAASSLPSRRDWITALWFNGLSGRELCIRVRPMSLHQSNGGKRAYQQQEEAMSDDKAQPRPRDPQRVNLDDEELEYWTHLFGCTRSELELAVKNVGVMAVDVERELQVLRS